MQALVEKLTLFSSTQKNPIIYRHTVLYFHFLTSVGSWICSLSSLTFTVWYFFILVYQYSQHLGKRGKGSCLTVDTVALSVLKHFNKRLALQRVNLWRYTYSYYQHEQSLYIYKHVHAGILNVIYIAPKNSKVGTKFLNIWFKSSSMEMWNITSCNKSMKKIWIRYLLE